MSSRTKLLMANGVPLVVFPIVALVMGLLQFRSSLYAEKEGNLRSTALAAMTLYSSLGYGDYTRRDNGNVWRGLNMNISEKTNIIDDLKRQTGVDITFYFGNTVAMTLLTEKNGNRLIGMEANSDIRTYI